MWWCAIGGSWFDKLTMRERGDERESSSATFVLGNFLICNADDYRCILTLPHGELVEPRTTNHPSTLLKPLRQV
ncbi:hypothetical protein SAMN05443582_10359 [Phyllobacterium sp. OV277]|nr:hypothetical protein SAMN05443582_10359 [Phyllobacterium sp. OV277]